MSDIQQVREAGIRSAIIVDDGYDEAPQVDELRHEDAWESFFDDVYGASIARIEAVFPSFDPQDRQELKFNQKFINALWQQRETIRDLLGELFDAYEQKIHEIQPFLRMVESTLRELEIPFVTCGRDFVDAAVDVDLIVIDLFLGIRQVDTDRELTEQLISKVIERRDDSQLPSIVLMSQVPGIDELAKEFRQKVKLHASAFRHIKKRDLSKPGRMKGLILTLAMHRTDTLALANFVESWEDNAVKAVRTAASALRKIDIDDLQHIRNMLLRFEGINTSSYILDVFDRILQYEIESHSEVLDAAVKLDEVADDPAPLMISNDRDTYAVLEKTLFVNPKRRSHATGAEWPITFGDILGPKPGTQVKPRGLFSGRDDLVFFVASPACDLIRSDGLKTALLVSGSLKKIDISRPNLALEARKTPIICLDEGERFQIDWDFGDLRTINLDKAKQSLHPSRGDMSVIARLREGSALNLRQELLSNVGRVGELAPLPRSLRFRAVLHFPLQQGGTQAIVMPEGVNITGNVLIPRRGKNSAAIIDSNCEHELTEALIDLDLEKVSKKSQKFFKILNEQTRTRQLFRSGLQVELPLSTPRTAGLLRLGEEQPVKDSAKPKTDKVATIVNGTAAENLLASIQPDAGLILQVYLESDT